MPDIVLDISMFVLTIWPVPLLEVDVPPSAGFVVSADAEATGAAAPVFAELSLDDPHAVSSNAEATPEARTRAMRCRDTEFSLVVTRIIY
ncbi:hypothetical protein [Streptomyces shenzhenensis]|uniref:hypothetical protein n=1 Tax=Streptomyces TaxID=1883 RepID=UPI001F332F00|nr:hypothetical protein [Streptomyces shenzhenensis]